MKTKLPFLAASLLLAAAPAFADDLLDAVLWDGPTAFPAKPSPAPTAPAVPSVPSSQPSPPAAPTPTELQLRRELQELRERTERMEAERRQAEPARVPASDAGPEEDADTGPSWFFEVRGGVGPEHLFAGSIELARRIGRTPFDISLRGFVVDTEFKRPLLDTNGTEYHCGADLACLCRPWRGKTFSPFAGAGGRFELADWGRWGDEEDWFENDDSGTAREYSLVGRIGAELTVPNLERLTLKGEFIAGKLSRELLGGGIFRLGERFAVDAFAASIDLHQCRGMAFGGGMTLFF